ncbi:hypothetical protein L6164_005927 [Bauhinia variegata]|uniref:Uncharacterized protein n=1 Tax=Bauhinia variegata TaxID=167791 RepID=A0ACB9PSS6_BAUVA|nr:hypothetical protein L6164_005927 [Bauhinia variegata]
MESIIFESEMRARFRFTAANLLLNARKNHVNYQADYGLPYVPPYMDVIHGKVQNIRQGVNFAVGGATALDAEFILNKRNRKTIKTMESMNVQLGWFKKLKPSLCSNKQDIDRRRSSAPSSSRESSHELHCWLYNKRHG